MDWNSLNLIWKLRSTTGPSQGSDGVLSSLEELLGYLGALSATGLLNVRGTGR